MQSPPPSGTEDIRVIAKKWNWNFKYPNGAESPELHVPVGRPAKMIMRSEDVNHGFYVPAFRVKRDIIPGRFHYSWFTPTIEGTFDLFCSEYCGDNHSTMNAKVFVRERGRLREISRRGHQRARGYCGTRQMALRTQRLARVVTTREKTERQVRGHRIMVHGVNQSHWRRVQTQAVKKRCLTTSMS